MRISGNSVWFECKVIYGILIFDSTIFSFKRVDMARLTVLFKLTISIFVKRNGFVVVLSKYKLEPSAIKLPM